MTAPAKMYKSPVFLFLCAALGGIPRSPAIAADAELFPSKPIKIVVYMAPGGLIDTTARKFTEIAGRYTEATFVVENKPGAGGIIAMQKVQQQKADGHTLYACTKSNISKAVSCNVESYLSSFHWLALLMADPECIIVNSDTDIRSWHDLLADARQRPGEQNWLGPENGGLDHVMALKTWENAGIDAKWIPFASGSAARAKLLGKHGVAYVGNPREVLSNPSLRIAAVASPQRLPQFPQVPTFSELGLEGLENEFMWRGFAVKEGCPQHVIQWYDRLFRRVNDDREWREFWERGGIQVRYASHEEFSRIVTSDRRDFRKYLGQIGLLPDDHAARRWASHRGAGIVLFVAILAVAYLAAARMHLARSAELLIPGAVMGLAATFVLQSLAYPKSAGVSAASLPRMYALGIVLVAAALFASPRLRGGSQESVRPSSRGLWFMALMVGYWLLSLIIGYLPATVVFLIFSTIWLGARRPLVIAGITCGWLIVTAIVFVRMLYVPLPTGWLWERIL